MGYRHHKYTWTKPFASVNHNWSLIGPDMAVHFHVTLVDGYDPSPGLEYHFFEPREYQRNDPPSHLDCSLTGGRCWHDGTSLYAREHLWPLIEAMLRAGDHEGIFRLLEGEADSQRDRHPRLSPAGKVEGGEP